MRLHFDIETRSTLNLPKVGVYRYAQHQSTDVILACWAVDDGPVETWYAPDPIPSLLRTALTDPSCVVVAHNAGFERIMLQKVLGPKYGWPVVEDITRWDDTAARAARMALPRSLGDVAAALDLPIQKDDEGKQLMMRMCRPRKIEDDGKIVWWEDKERMSRLAAYCATDVIVERELDKILRPLSIKEKQIWDLTEVVNDRGIAVDLKFAEEALELAKEAGADLNSELSDLTDGVVAASTNVGAIKEWLRTEGYLVNEGNDETLNKKAIDILLSQKGISEKVRRVLEIRLQGGKSSIAKYQAIVDRASEDGRIRGNLLYHGASTGRFAGMGVQIQNLPRDAVKDWNKARKELPTAPNKMQLLSQMIRGTIKADTGKKLMWADYSAVEARGTAWVSGQQDLVEAFRNGEKIYEKMAARIFLMRSEEIQKDSIQRFIGKTVVLGCGYSMGATKFRLTCAAQGQDISEELAHRAVQVYRGSYPAITMFWKRINEMVIAAVQNKGKTCKYRNLHAICDDQWLAIGLPSGRYLYYHRPQVIQQTGAFGQSLALQFWSVNQVTRNWNQEVTYGGKLTENIVSAICRDFMANAMLALEAKGYNVIASVHDEVICEVPKNGTHSIDEMCSIMCEVPRWAEGFPLAAEGKEGERYGK